MHKNITKSKKVKSPFLLISPLFSITYNREKRLIPVGSIRGIFFSQIGKDKIFNITI